MRLPLLLLTAALSGCITMSPQDMSRQSNWDVCRFTTGGPHSEVAEQVRQARGLDCRPYYPAIAAKMQADNAAIGNFLRAMRPAPPPPISTPTYCRTVRNGNIYNTVCD